MVAENDYESYEPTILETESSLDKLKRKSLAQPYVPLGVAVTVYILIQGLRAFRRGDQAQSQKLMRWRVFAQGATIFGIGLGVFTQAKK